MTIIIQNHEKWDLNVCDVTNILRNPINNKLVWCYSSQWFQPFSGKIMAIIYKL